MLHLSFTQQLCHTKNLTQGDAANDDHAFVVETDDRKTSRDDIERTNQRDLTPSDALKRLAKSLLGG